MNTKEAEKEFNEIKQRVKALEALMTHVQQPEDRFVPQIKRRYWYVDSIGEKSTSIWTNSPGDLYRLATGNCHRTEADARRHKAGLFVKTPTGPCPKVGDELHYFDLSLPRTYRFSPSEKDGLWDWESGEACIKGYEAELEAKWKRYGWSVTGEPEPEGWES